MHQRCMNKAVRPFLERMHAIMRMSLWLWDGSHIFHHLAANASVHLSELQNFCLVFILSCCARRIFQFTMPILWIFRYKFWCLAVLFTMVSSTTQSIFDKILPTSSPARNESAPLSSSTITTTIQPTTTPFSSSRETPVAPQLYTVEVGKVRIPLTFLLHTMTQLKIVQKGNFQFVPDTIHANVGDIVGRTVMKAFESRTFLTMHGRIQILPRKPLSSSSRISTPLRPIRTVRAGKSRLLLRVQTC